MSSHSISSRLAAVGCAVLAGGLMLPPLASAEPSTKHATFLDSARAVTAREAGAKLERRAIQAAPAPKTDLRSGSFFKSPVGILAIVAFGAGVGYAVYSSSNDRIRSEGR